MSQLTLLPYFDEVHVLDAAMDLLNMLNDGCKEKERYYTQFYFQEGAHWVFMVAKDKTTPPMFNVLTSEGKIPSGFSANWRIWPHVLQEFKELNTK